MSLSDETIRAIKITDIFWITNSKRPYLNVTFLMGHQRHLIETRGGKIKNTFRPHGKKIGVCKDTTKDQAAIAKKAFMLAKDLRSKGTLLTLIFLLIFTLYLSYNLFHIYKSYLII